MRFSQFAEGRGRMTDTSAVSVILNHDAARRCAEASEEVERAEVGLDAAKAVEEGRMAQPRVERAQQRLQAAENELEAAFEAAREHVYEFTLQSLSAAAWDKLVAENPPTEEQTERLGPRVRLQWNPDTFPVALIGACLVDARPVDGGETLEFDSDDDIAALRDQVKPTTWDQLWAAAYALHKSEDQVPSGLGGSATTRSSGSA